MHQTTIAASPRARRAMRARGINPSTLKGSGPAGRIVDRDVTRWRPDSGSDSQRRPLSSLRRTIARRLVQSKQTVPHFYIRQTIDAAPLVAFHASSKAQFPCSLNDIIVKASAIAVSEFPAFRSQIDGDDIIEYTHTHLGLAVGIEDGVVVAQVAHADRLGLRELAVETRRVATLARERRPQGSVTSVFTISNLGMFGTDEFSAIINPPEAAILAVGAVRDQAMVRSAALYAGKALTVTLSCDHRIIDGLGAAKFIARLREILEAPQQFITL